MQSLTLEWGGEQFTVPPHRVIRLGADLEDMLSTDTLNAWHRFSKPGRMNINLLAMAYGYALRFAGASCTDEQVRSALFYEGDKQQRVMEAMVGLQAIMAPPAPIADKVSQMKGKDQAKTETM